MIHVAVKRRLPYYHHYVILAEKSVWNCYLKIVQYNGGPSYFFKGSTGGEIEEADITISQVETEICDGLYVITGTDYPTKAIDFVDACARYLIRLRERSYSVVYNNCEHLATYIMTGCVKSEQIEKSGRLKKAMADTMDITVNDGKSNFFNTAINTAGNTAASVGFVIMAGKQVVSAVSRGVISNSVHMAGTSYTAQNLISFTAQNFSTCCTTEQMLCSQTCCDIAEKAGTSALIKTGLVCGGLTLVTETGLAVWKIYKLNKMRKAGQIKKRDFIRETLKSILTVPVATALTVFGSVFGQIICPIPFLGACVGGFLGNILGRILAGVVTGMIFDRVVSILK